MSACVIAAALRMAFDSALPPGFPYLTFFPAVVVTTYLFGLRPGIVCAVLSGLVAWYCFIPPAHTFVLTWHIVVALGFYAFVVALDIALINGLRRTTDHLFSSMATVETLHASLEMQVGQRTRELQRATALKSAVLDHAGYAVIATDGLGIITLFNPAAERLLGFSATEVVGQVSLVSLHDTRLIEERAAALSREFGQAISPGFETLVLRTRRGCQNMDEWTFVTKGGVRVPVLLNLNALRSEDGSELGFIGIATDLSEQHRREAELRAANAGTWRIDIALRCVWFSAECARQHGLGDAPVELPIERGWALLAHPLDAPRVIADLQAAIIAAGSLRTEFRVPCKDRNVRWLTAIGNVEKDAQGVPCRVMGLTVDVTESKETEIALRESEARYRMLAENTADMIVRSDLAMTRRYVSPACRRLLGYEPHELIGTRPADTVHPDDCETDLAACRELREGRVDTSVKVQRYRRKDGSFVWVEVHSRRVDDETGAATGFIACVRDISAHHAQAEALSEAKSAAERASQAKTDFLAAMSHEIRTPLNAIIGFTDLMIGSGRLDGELKRHASHIQGSGTHLLNVVDDILDFSKVEAGALELRLEPFSLRTIIDESCSMVRGVAEAKGLELILAVDAGLPKTMVGDHARLRQVLVNLLNNAVKFTRAGTVTLSVRHLLENKVCDRVRFSVVDTGIGIPQDKLSGLFQRFHQVDGSIQRNFGGTGLGLAIAKRLVALMDGEIGVVSKDGDGSTFWFEVVLPRALPVHVEMPVRAPVSTYRRANILLVEDNAVNQELAEEILRANGHTVQVVNDGAAAVHAVETGDHDLVLMDIQMQGMDGMAATRRIRDLPSPRCGIPVVAMTANVLPEQIRQFRASGLDDHISKPINAMELHATMQKWLTISGDEGDLETKFSFDRTIYDCARKLFSPTKIADILNLFKHEMSANFKDTHMTAEGRAAIRNQAHSIASSAKLLGFIGLSDACRSLERSTEQQIAADGMIKFEEKLRHVRLLTGAAADRSEILLSECLERTRKWNDTL